jgi:RNA polymerase sigma-70 factor (ECF subfamily)
MGTGESPAGVFEQHSRDVYGWAYRLLGRHHDALDVVQDVFLRWNKQCAESEPARPRGWLRRVTVNRAIDVRRARRTEEARRADSRASLAVAHEARRDAADLEVLRGDVAAALDALTDVQRGVLIAKVYDGLTFAKIAGEHDLAISTVKTHYLRAIRAVRDRLQGRWGERD